MFNYVSEFLNGDGERYEKWLEDHCVVCYTMWVFIIFYYVGTTGVVELHSSGSSP